MATLPTIPGSRSGSSRSSITYIPAFPAPARRPREAYIHDRVLVQRIENDNLQFDGDDSEYSPTNSPVKSVSYSTEDPNLVQWDGPNDPQNPVNWPARRKWLITMVAVITTVNVTFASTAAAETTFALIREFDISLEVSYLVTSCFLFGYVFGPPFWGPGSELIGRRPIFIITMICYTALHVGQALAPNIETLLVTRFLAGFFAIAPMISSAGVIADMFPAEGRGPATSLFTAGVFVGPVIGPIVSGYIIYCNVSWKWVFWVMMIFAGVCTVIAILFLPETFAPVLLLRKAKVLREANPMANAKLYSEHEREDWSLYGVVRRTLFRAVEMLFFEPILVLITVYLSIVYGLLYGLFEAVPVIFMELRGFNEGQDGLIFIGVGIGTTIGALMNLYFSRNYKELSRKWKGFPPPEERLTGAMIGAPVFVIAIFWLGWTGQYLSIPWYVPALSMVPMGAGLSLIFMSFLGYLVDTYLIYSASAFAVNTIVRSAVAAAFPLFIVQTLNNLGINWACTLFGLIALLFVPSPFLFYKYGRKIRAKSRFAPCTDLKIAKELEAEERKMRSEKVAYI